MFEIRVALTGRIVGVYNSYSEAYEKVQELAKVEGYIFNIVDCTEH